MSVYRDFSAAYFKRYASSMTKQAIQEKCNSDWRALTDKFKGADLTAAANKKISALQEETASVTSGLLRFFAKASTPASGSRPATSASPEAESSRPECSSQPPVENVELDPDDPPEGEASSEPVLKRKYATPAQETARQKVNALQTRLSAALLARDADVEANIEKEIKKTRKEISKQEQVLKNKQKNAQYQAKYREKVKEKLKKVASSSTDIGARSEPGRPRLEDEQDGLLEAIKAAAIYGSAAHDRRQTDEIKTCKTLDSLKGLLDDAGYVISRSALYTRLLPKNSRTGQGSRHVVTVPVRLSKPSNDLHKKHPDGKFCTATMRNLESLASILGPKQCAFISQDDKARVPIGITAAKEQSHLVMHVDYRVQLPDHDFIIGEKHKLIPSVYAAISIKPDGKGDPSAVTYSGPTFIAIRSGKHSSSTAASHAYDVRSILNEPSFSELLKTDKGDVKPILIFTVDGGPDENPRFPKNIAFAIEHFRNLNLDALFVATNAPGRSAFNRVERRMAPLSKQLTGVVLPYDTYGTHLDGRGRTTDPELELRNFQAAAETLAGLWNELVIDSFPVTARYEGPGAEAEVPPNVDPAWYSRHVRESQYCLQVVKCDTAECCGEMRSDLKLVLQSGFLPPPVRCVQDPDTGRIRGLGASENVEGAHFLPLFQTLAVQLPLPTFSETVPYDFSCPTVQGDVERGRRVCKACGLYFASITAADNHYRGMHSRALQPRVRPQNQPQAPPDAPPDAPPAAPQDAPPAAPPAAPQDAPPAAPAGPVHDGRRRSRRIASQVAKRTGEVLCRTVHEATGGEDVEWLQEAEVGPDVPLEAVAAAEDRLPLVTDWQDWFKNPFTTDD